MESAQEADDAAKQMRRGAAALVLIAVMLVVLLAMAVISIDVGYMQLVRTELRAATDASARAGTETLSRLQDPDLAIQAAIDAAARNQVAGMPLVLTANEVTLGRAAPGAGGRFAFQPGVRPFNSVQVFARKSNATAAGPAQLLLGRLLGVAAFEPQQLATATHVDREICLVLDRSGSMAWGLTSGIPGGLSSCDPPHSTLSRWAMVANAVTVFFDELNQTEVQERIAMVSYGSNSNGCNRTYQVVQVDQQLTADYTLLQTALGNISAHPIVGATAIGRGVEQGRVVLNGANVRPLADRTMIVLTDGIHNNGYEPIIPAQQAAVDGITIHTITFSDQADTARMAAVAAAAGGRHFHAPDEQRLREVFREIARTLPVVLTD